MKTEESRVRRNLVSIFAIMLGAVVLMLILTADVFDRKYRERITIFSGDWCDTEGNLHDIEDLTAGNSDHKVLITKKLPEQITDSDCLCFESRNINFNVYVEGTKLYSFQSRPNLSGLGYGRAFHVVNLRTAYSGQTIKILMEGMYEGHKGGKIFGVYVSPAADYMHLQVEERTLSVLLSTLISFFGIIMVLIFIWIPGKERLPFDIASLGEAAFALGIWLFVDTGIMQLLTGQLYAWRALDRIVIFFVGFPLISFFNSMTVRKRLIYQKIWIIATIVMVTLIIGLRYFAGVDMIESYTVFLTIYIIGILLTIVCIFADNAIYCRQHQISVKMKHFFIGLCVLVSCAVLDLITYSAKLFVVESYGNFTRIGTVAFIMIMMSQFLSWWTKDQATIGRERFVNRVLQDSISSGSTEDSIRSVLQYIGTEMNVGRVVIFEERTKGKYHGTYEWHEESRDPDALELLYLPYQGLLDTFYDSYRANKKSLVVEDVATNWNADPALINVLSSNHITSLVATPLEINDKMAGIFALVDVPKQAIPDAAEIIGYISYFLTQLVMRRDEEKRLRHYSYNDTLSGALNRRAYREYIDQDMDKSVSFGYLICEIDGLKDANTTRGFDFGDRMVQTVVDTLGEIFGQDSVYRVGGSQFVAFGSESEEAFFNNDVERFQRKVEENGIHVFVGTVYCMYGTRDISTVIARANQHLDEERNANSIY